MIRLPNRWIFNSEISRVCDYSSKCAGGRCLRTDQANLVLLCAGPPRKITRHGTETQFICCRSLPSQLRFMVFAAASAMRTGIARKRILNCMSREELLDWVRDVRGATIRRKGHN